MSIASTALSDNETKQTADDADDIVWGAVNIGRVINRTARQVFHLHARGLIPTQSVGRQIVGSRSKLRAYLAGEARD